MLGSRLSFSVSTPPAQSRNPSRDCGFFHADAQSGLVLLELRGRQAVRWALMEHAEGVASFTRVGALQEDVEASVREQMRTAFSVTEKGAPLDWRKLTVRPMGAEKWLHAKLDVQDVEDVRLQPLDASGAVVTLHGILGVQDLAGTGRLCADSCSLWQAYWACQP